ncbi:MAG: hypothetical protein RI911_849, partial [Candidatus Parcubacteria bacterium]
MFPNRDRYHISRCDIGRSSNGRTEAFEAFNLGSIPSLPAMNEIANSIKEEIKNRANNSIYGVFMLSWLVFHWNFIFSLLFLSEDNILLKTGLLKNEFLVARYFNLHSFYFWVSWIVPFLLTYVVIWKLPKWVLIKAYTKTEEYATQKQIIRMGEQKKIERANTELQERLARNVSVIAKRVEEEKKIKQTDPTLGWDEDY